MTKYVIIMCGGAGKTKIYEKYPNLFLDIDHFIWNQNNKTYREQLMTYVEKGDIKNISKLYKNIMKLDSELRNDNRIILTHHPDNAKDLNREILDIIRPIEDLHLINIQKREKAHQQFSINDFHELTKYKPYEYKTYKQLEERLLQCVDMTNAI